jgi:hypothetical protein
MWLWFLAGALVLLNAATVVIALGVTRLHLRRAARRRAAVEPDGGGDEADLSGVCDEAAAMIRQLDRLGRDIDTRIAERAEGLRALLAKADHRIAELRRLSDPRPGQAADGAPADPRQRLILRLAGHRMDPVEIARRVGVDVGEVELVLSLYGSAPAESA